MPVSRACACCLYVHCLLARCVTRGQGGWERAFQEMEAQFKPFNAAALAFYSQHMGEKVTAAQAQKALGNLRENDPPLVWKSLRGDYSLYDQEMAGWYAYLKGGHNWPPKRLS